MDHNDRAITSLVVLSHSLVHTYEFAIPIFIPVWLAQFNATPALVGGAVTVGLALYGVGSLPSGILADRIGSQPLLVGCLVGMGIAFVGVSAAPNLPVLALVLAIWGAAASVHHPSGLTLITKGANTRGDVFAYHGMSGNIGTAVGPLLTTLLLVVFSDEWRLVALVLALPALAGAVLAARIDVDETAAVSVATDGGQADTGVESMSEFIDTSKLLFASAFIIVFGMVMSYGLYYRGSLTFLPQLFAGFSAIQPIQAFGATFEPGNYVFAGLLAMGIFGQYTGGKLTDRVPVEVGLITGFIGLAVLAVGYLPAANAGLGPLLVLSAVFGFVLFYVQPFYQAAVAEYTPPAARGLSYGFTYLGDFGIGALAASLAGAVLTYFSPLVLFMLLAVFAVIGGGFSAYLFVRASPE
ncbi:MFS transporter [Halococcus sediminicola]|uniref:MFS transporter n=1 Tax=Halococcus sediminicola TaxID=1264579 RepID=UPI000678B91A|nr:MFS transporter [Halococcus sediminicola]